MPEQYVIGERSVRPVRGWKVGDFDLMRHDATASVTSRHAMIGRRYRLLKGAGPRWTARGLAGFVGG
jgi:hypothetical protein